MWEEESRQEQARVDISRKRAENTMESANVEEQSLIGTPPPRNASTVLSGNAEKFH